MEVGRIGPAFYRRITEHPAGRNCRMEESTGKTGLLDSVRDDIVSAQHLTKKKARKAEDSSIRDSEIPNWGVFLITHIFRFAQYRLPLAVTEYIVYHDTFGGESVYYVCPRCGITLDREYQAYCDRCGQRLDWKRINKAVCRHCTH